LTNESPRRFTNAEYVRAAKISWSLEILNDESVEKNYKNQNDRMKFLIDTLGKCLSKIENRGNISPPPEYTTAVTIATTYKTNQKQILIFTKSNRNTQLLAKCLIKTIEKIENN
jgi:hypothetical protein